MDRNVNRRRFLADSIALLGGSLLPLGALAQPASGMARIICGYPPGGSVDVVSRKLAERLNGGYAKAVIVDNKPGAAGRIAVDELKRLPADGSAMLVTPASVVTMYPHIYRQLSYDPFSDLTPVSTVAITGFGLAVGPLVPPSVKSVNDFARWCRENAALASCGNAGAGSMPHFMALLLARALEIELTHVPFRGGGVAMQAAAAGQCAAALATESSTLPFVQAGKLRVLATTNAQRSPFLPQSPTFAELGHAQLTQREWFGAFMPAGTPSATIAKAGDALRDALRQADVGEVWDKLALEPAGTTSDELQAMMRKEHDFWGPLIRSSGFTPEA